MNKTEANILFIDDEEINLFVNKEVTRRTFPMCRIFTATSVEAGLALLKINHSLTFIVFLDLNIGARSGIDFLNEVGILQNACKVYILSSSINRKEIDQAMSYSFVHAFIPKPLLSGHLTDALKEYERN